MSFKMKKLISVFLILAMVISNEAMVVFADSINEIDVTIERSNDILMGENSDNINDESNKENKDSVIILDSEVTKNTSIENELAENESSSFDFEPEVDESTAMPTEPEIDESVILPTELEFDESLNLPTEPEVDESLNFPTEPEVNESLNLQSEVGESESTTVVIEPNENESTTVLKEHTDGETSTSILVNSEEVDEKTVINNIITNENLTQLSSQSVTNDINNLNIVEPEEVVNLVNEVHIENITKSTNSDVNKTILNISTSSDVNNTILNISTSSETYIINSVLSTISEVSLTEITISTNSEIKLIEATQSETTNLFGADGPYILKNNWLGDTDNVSSTSILKNSIQTITIIKAPSFKSTTDNHYEIPDSNGLELHILNSERDIIIYAPENKSIMVDADASYLFSSTNDSAKLISLTTIDGLYLLDTTNVTNMSHMFDGAINLKALDLKSFNTSNVQYMESMFENCEKLITIQASNSFNTANVSDNGNNMFLGCDVLESDKGTKCIEVSNTDINYAKIDTGSNDGYLSSPFYTFPTNWDVWYMNDVRDSNVIDQKQKRTVTKITFKKVPESRPSTYDYMWQIPNSNGLFGFINGNEIEIYLSEDYTMYASTDMSFLFSSAGNTGYYSAVENIVNLNYLDTSNSTNMAGVFSNCQSIRSIDLSSFKTSSVSNMSNMFRRCWVLENLDLTSFNTSSVQDMSGMFLSCNALKSLDLTSFNTSNCSSIQFMFQDCTSLITLDISSFDTRNIHDMSKLFQNCRSLQQIDVSNFNTSNVTTFASMFEDCWSLNSIDMSNLNTSQVITMDAICYGCTNLTNAKFNNLSNDRLTNLNSMFRGCQSLKNVEFTNFNTSNVENYSYMFTNCRSLIELELQDFEMKSTPNMNIAWMFSGCRGLRTIYVSSKWGREVAQNDNYSTFYDCNNLVGEYGTSIASLVASGVDEDVAIKGRYAQIDEGLTSGNAGFLTTVYYVLTPTWFTNALAFTDKPHIDSITILKNSDATPSSALFTFDLLGSGGLKGYITLSHRVGTDNYYDVYIYPPRNTGIRSAIDSSYLFSDRNLASTFSSLSTISNIKNIDTRRVKNMSYMFYGAGLKEFYGDLIDTSSATDLSYMFADMDRISTISIASFNTSNVSHMNYMFSDVSNLKSIDFGNIDTKKVKQMEYMFYLDEKLTELNLETFDTKNVEDMSRMFAGCENLKTIITTRRFVTTKLTSPQKHHLMFERCLALEGGNGTRFVDKNANNPSSSLDKTYAIIDGYEGNDGYFTENYFVFSNNWANFSSEFIDNSTYNKNQVASISFIRTPELPPTTFQYQWDLVDSNGLKAYIIDSAESGFYDIIIYAPKEVSIYTSENADYLFGNNLTNQYSSDDYLGGFNHCKEIKNLNYLNTSRTTSFRMMFRNMMSLTKIDLSGFDTRNLTNTSYMFAHCASISSIDLATFSFEKVTNASHMFYYCENLESITSFELNPRSNASIDYLFSFCLKLKNLDISKFNTEYVIDMSYMFDSCRSITSLDLSNFDTSRVSRFSGMFGYMSSLKYLNVKSFNTKNCNSFQWMFARLESIEELDLSSFTSNQEYVGGYGMFATCGKLRTIYVSKDFPKIQSDHSDMMFYHCYELVGGAGTRFIDQAWADYNQHNHTFAKIDTPETPGYFTLFNYTLNRDWTGNNDSAYIGVEPHVSNYRKNNIEEITFSIYPEATPANVNYVWEIPESKGLRGYVYNTNKIMIYAPINAGISAATNSDALFSSLSGDDKTFNNVKRINNLNYLSTKKVIKMSNMFKDMRNLESLDLSNFNTSSVSNTESMFKNCNTLEKLDLSGFDTRNVNNMQEMFSEMTNLKELNLKNFDTSRVDNMSQMFYHDQNLKTIYATDTFDTFAVTNGNNMFDGCTSLEGGTGTKYVDMETLDPTNFKTVQYALIDGLNGNVGYLTNFNYVITNHWTGDISSEFIGVAPDISTYTKDSIVEITIATSPTLAPSTYDYKWELPDSNGLMGYVYDSNKIMIHAPENYAIYSDTDSSYLFSSPLDEASKLFSNVAVIFGLENLHTDRTTNMKAMFANMENATDLDVSAFNTEKVTDMSSMFYNVKQITTLNLDSFDTSNVVDMSQMFKNLESIQRLNLLSFNTQNTTKMARMFESCINLSSIYATTNFVVTQVIDDTDMFNNCIVLEGIDGTTYADKFAINETTAKNKTFAWIDGRNNLQGYFSATTYVLNNDWTGSNSSNNFPATVPISKDTITKISFVKSPVAAPSTYEYNWDIPDSNGLKGYIVGTEVIIYAENDLPIYTSDNASYLFSSNGGTTFDSLIEIENLSELNTKHTKYMNNMFENCSSLTNIDLSGFNTAKVQNMSYMFAGTTSANSINVSSFDTSSVQDMSYMYQNSILNDIDLSHFVTASVSNMSHMFDGCQQATNIDVSNFDTSNVTNMEFLFKDCINLTQIDVTNFDTSKVTTMESLFENCQSLSLLDTSFFNTRNVLIMKNMFKDCSHLVTLHGSTDFVVTQVIDDTDMFLGCQMLDGGAGTNYAANYSVDPTTAVTKQYAWIDMHQGRPGYFNGIIKMVNVNLKSNGGKFRNGNENIRTQIAEFTPTAVFEEPTKDGYEFKGYKVDGNPLNPIWDYGQFERDVVATWDANKYKIIYSANGGIGNMDFDIATYGNIYRIKENVFTKRGFDFGGWLFEGHTYQSNDAVSNLTTVNNGEVVMLANWIGKNYTIKYHANGGNGNMADEVVSYGIDHTIRSNSFNRAGYTFNGWSTSVNSAVAYGNSATIFSNEEYREEINLYAQWIKDTSIFGTLELRGNGGYINGVPTFTMHYYENQEIIDVTKYRNGYEFSEWLDLNNAVAEYPTICTFSNTKTLKANWNAGTYKIVYHSNNGMANTYEEDVDVSSTSHNLKTIVELTWTKQNYRFAGWSIRSGEDTIIYNDGEDIGQISVDRIDLYAVWTGYTYTITLNEWNKLAVGANRNKSETFTYGLNKRIAIIATNSYTEAGIEYLFKGWDGLVAGELAYLDNHLADRIFEDLGGNIDGANITLNSLWVNSANSNKLIFDGNSGSINGRRMFMITLAIGDNIPYSIVESTAYKRNHLFSRWLDADLTTPFNSPTADWVGTKVIYADWTTANVEYTLKYVAIDKDSTSPTMADETKSCSAEFNLTNNTYTRLGYEFIGWDTNENADTVVYRDGQRVKELGDIGDVVTLYAVWTDVIYTINFYDYNNTLIDSSSLSYNGSAIVLPNNIPIGKLDAGYKYTDTSGEKIFFSGQRISIRDFTITPTITTFDLRGEVVDKIYRATFNANGGKFDDNTSVKIVEFKYLDPVHLASVSRTSYTFGSWQVNGINFTGNTYSYDDDVTFIVRWTGGPRPVTPPPPPGFGGGGNGGGGGGGGGGGVTGGTLPIENQPLTGVIDISVHYKIPQSDYEWKYNAAGERISLKVKKTNLLVTAFKSNSEFNNRYEDIANEDYVILKKGFYLIDQFNGIYIGIDNFGNVITGFVITESTHKNYDINPTNATLISIGDKKSAKYYLEQNGLYRGMIWNLPKVINNICYIFDTQGRVTKEITLRSGVRVVFDGAEGAFEYFPTDNSWKYYIVDVFGKKQYYTGLLYIISASGEIHTYIFDEQGIMKTGVVEYRGKTYILQPEGVLKGAAIVGEINLGGKRLVFNELGELQN